MAKASDYLEQQIYNHIFRNDTFLKPSGLAIALCKDYPTDSSYTELDAVDYVRQSTYSSGDSKWDAMAVAGSGFNTAEIAWSAATSDWGYASGVVFLDDPRIGAGNMLLRGNLTTPKNITNGDTFKFTALDVSITIG